MVLEEADTPMPNGGNHLGIRAYEMIGILGAALVYRML